jgi:hypothetical protein
VRQEYELGLLHFSIGVQVGHENYHSGERNFSQRNELLRHIQSLILVFITVATCAIPPVHTSCVLDQCFALASREIGVS